MITRRGALAGLASALATPALGQGSKASDLAELAYDDTSPRNRLDIHRPEGRGPFPVLLDIHGGGFLSGDKRQLAVPAPVLAAGIAVARMNYRLSNQARWPAQHEDVLAAAHFLQSRAGELGLVPGRLALGGRSAGAFLAVSAALSMVQKGKAPAAVVDFYGPMDFGSMDADMARLGMPVKRPPADSPQSVESLLIGYAVGARRHEASAMGPVGRLDAMADGLALPPLMIRHGLMDSIVSAGQAEHLRRAWRRVDPRTEIDFKLLKSEGHGTRAFGGAEVLGDMARFLTRHLKPVAG
ncbi:MAG: alpha/beta hydrolase [Paracoccus sp. (in: a-proteobacteria)]|uniref:alpha/beta hydrolase fold domain-containing protein n=1 Tax=Paracoccus sp. TaxID=267 RepID=UPI0039E5DD47